MLGGCRLSTGGVFTPPRGGGVKISLVTRFEVPQMSEESIIASASPKQKSVVFTYYTGSVCLQCIGLSLITVSNNIVNIRRTAVPPHFRFTRSLVPHSSSNNPHHAHHH